MTLYLHEEHRVVGRSEDEFEAAFRDSGGWMERLGEGDQGRLLGFYHRAHGAGPSYRVVTLTAVADGAAWEHLARRVHDGDLRDLARRTDALRHDVTAKILLPLDWSPLADLDLGSIAAVPADHPPALYMEDTMWPERGQLADYLTGAASHYAPLIASPDSLLDLSAAFVAAPGGGRRPEVVLLQKVCDPGRLVRLLVTEISAERRAPGTWMHDALEWRDQWRSSLLRSSTWSPWA